MSGILTQEDPRPTRHKLGSSSPIFARPPLGLGRSRSRPGGLVHLLCMDTNTDTLETVLSLSELAARLRVSDPDCNRASGRSRELREMLPMTQTDLANGVGISQKRVSEIERGQVDFTRLTPVCGTPRRSVPNSG